MNWQEKLAKLVEKQPEVLAGVVGENQPQPNRFAGLLDVGQEAAQQSQPVDKPAWAGKLAEMAVAGNPPLPAQNVTTPEPSAPAYSRTQPDITGGIATPVTEDSTLPPTALDVARGNLTRLQNEQLVDKDKGWKGRLKEFALNALAGVGNANPQGGIGGLIGSAIGGGVGGVIDKTANERRDWQGRLAKAQQNYGMQSQMADEDLGRKYKQAQIDTIPIDDELKRRQIADMAKYRTDKLAQDAEAAEAKKQSTARAALYKGQWFDPDNPIHRAQAEEAKLDPATLPKFDRREPKLHKIGDSSYVYNAETGSYEDSGLPKEKNKSLVEYTVVDPNTGVETKYATTQEKAASLKQSFANAGMQIRAANERQAKDIEYKKGKDTQDRADRAVREAAATNLKIIIENTRRIDGLLKSETDFNRRKQLQDERIEAVKQGKILADQLKEDN